MESLLASRHKRELGHCSSFCEGALRPGRPQRMATPIDGTAFHGAMLPRWRGRGDVRTPASPSRPGLLHVGDREVSFQLARSNDASLPEHVRDRMAAAQEVGALELEFQVRLFQGVDAVSGRPMRVCCMVNMMTTGGAVQQPDVTGCTVFNSLGRTGSTTPHN
jgi:hypothetical protein